MSPAEIQALARELLSAHITGDAVSPPSARHEDFDLKAAYAVEAEICRLRQESGRRAAGLKVGYANKAIWRVLKIETLLWAHMYDDTVHTANELALPYYRSPKIEPEIVFKLKQPVDSAAPDAAAVLASVDWMAIGFEIIDCPYPEWQFQPADFVAALGLHRALALGEPQAIDSATAAGLANFKVQVSKDGEFVEEGSARNCLRSPALCLSELARALHREPGGPQLSAGDLISTGTLTSGHPIRRGETWQVNVDGLPLSPLTLRLA